MAIALRAELYQQDVFDIIISDHSRNAEYVAKRTTEIGYFSGVIFAESKSFDHINNKNFLKAISTSIEAAKGNEEKFSKYILRDSYDELIYYNFDMFANAIFAMLYRKNRDIICNRVEEGTPSYSMNINYADMQYTRRMVATKFFRKITGRSNLKDRTKGMYCLHPELYHGSLEKRKMSITNRTLDILKKTTSFIFNVHPESLIYDKKYIIFTSIGDFEGGKPVGEFEIINKLSELIGKENMIIKTHPRDTRNLYAENGFLVDEQSWVPWEVIVLNHDFKNNVFISITSGSILFGNAISQNSPETFFLYKLCKNKSDNSVYQNAVKAYEEIFSQHESSKIFNHVHIPDRIEEVVDCNE